MPSSSPRWLVIVLAAAAVMGALVDALEPKSQAFENENVQREFLLSNNVAVEMMFTVKATRKDPSATEYVATFPSEKDGGRVGMVYCQVGKEDVKGVTVEKSDDELVVRVPVPKSFTSDTINCSYIRLGRNVVRPYPAEIHQLAQQKFLFDGDTLRYRSPYTLTGSEVTLLTFASKAMVLDELPGVTVAGKVVKCGVYNKPATPEEQNMRLRIQYDASFPFPVATTVEREIEISHWGNVAVEEYFDVRNDGAKLKGEFSRLDHQTHIINNAFQALQATLPADAWGVYYRDELGNVTTSNLFKPKDKKSTELQLKLRFPLYGGWHINWYHGYNVPLTSFVSEVQGTPNRYVLDCELGPPIRMLTENLILHVVLPPGATNVRVESPTQDRIVSESTFRRYTYLDVPWTARNVLKLELHDVIPQPGSKQSLNRLRVYYTYSNVHILEKPLTLSATLFSLLMGFMAWGRLGVSS